MLGRLGWYVTTIGTLLVAFLRRGANVSSLVFNLARSMLSTCCPVRFVMRSTLGQQQQNLGLGLTIIRPVLERIQGFLLSWP